MNIRQTKYTDTGDGSSHSTGTVTIHYATGHVDTFEGIKRAEYMPWWRSTWRGRIPSGIKIRAEETRAPQEQEVLLVRGRYDMPTWDSIREKRLKRAQEAKEQLTKKAETKSTSRVDISVVSKKVTRLNGE